MRSTRCEEVIVQLVVRTYDDDGRPVLEQTSQPVKVFRNAQTRDFWAEVDKAVKAMQTPPARAASKKSAKAKP
jgi:hypothetical protein